MMGLQRLACLAQLGFCLHVTCAARSASPSKFLIVSAPRDSRVSYMRISHGMQHRSAQGRPEMKSLIGTGLVHPQGLAVEQKANRLLIADPDARRIFAYPLHVQGDTLSVGKPGVLVDGVESRWVSVDGLGNIYFTDEPRNQILKIGRSQTLRANATPRVVFDGASLTQVSAPGGVASDSFHAYWVNKQVGTQVGSVVRGAESLGTSILQADVQPIAKVTDKSYGICLATNNVFFTQPESTIFGVKKGGSSVVAVSDRLTNPRGCAWDGDGTVYVADRGANAVYSFASNMPTLSAAQLSKTVDFQDAFGVAVYSGAARLQRWAALGLALLAAALC
mmetsp:Transcript_102930/g.332085  ORF Transcript_102930/g.332085 Transcript_102930/m.332085 type:complete len:335 (+) Transcript_102930:111-1115(+)